MKPLKLSLGILALLLVLAQSRASATVLCSSCAYITGNDVVYSWDVGHNQLTQVLTAPAGSTLDSLVFDTKGDIIFDSDNTSDLYIYNPTTGTGVPTLLANLGAVGASNLADIALEPSGGSILVSSRNSDQIFRINLSNGQSTVLYPPSGTTGVRPDGLVYDNTGRLFACLSLSEVAQLDPVTGKILNSISGIKGADGLTFNSTTGMLYVGSDDGGFYTIDTNLSNATFTSLAGTIPAGEEIDGVGTAGTFLYLVHWVGSCSNSDCGKAIQYNLSTNQVSLVNQPINGADDIAPLSGLGSPLEPILSSLTPNTTAAGSPAFTMTVNGLQFVSGATVTWNGSNLTTAFVNSTQLTAVVPAADVANPASINVGVTNPDSQASNTLTFTITSSGGGNPPTIAFTANPGTISAGGASTLSWTIANATSAVINQGIGSISPTSGTQSVSPANSTTYTLTAWGLGGSTQVQVTVTVNSGGGVNAPSISFSASPTTITSGGTSTLSWTITNATSAVIDQGIGPVSPTSGTQGVSPTGMTTYILTAWGLGGSSSNQVTVNVNPPPRADLHLGFSSSRQSAHWRYGTV